VRPSTGAEPAVRPVPPRSDASGAEAAAGSDAEAAAGGDAEAASDARGAEAAAGSDAGDGEAAGGSDSAEPAKPDIPPDGTNDSATSN
jgi:hypothetical protein